MRSMMAESKRSSEVVTLAGGCFWCLQPVFQELRGVEKVEVGYSGGRLVNPSYEAVCTDTTGHAEAVQVTFDPTVIPLADILRIFFSVHDPTTLNRQGGDVGTQYRSAIFYNSPEQEKTARQVMAEIFKAGIWDGQSLQKSCPCSRSTGPRNTIRTTSGRTRPRATAASSSPRKSRSFASSSRRGSRPRRSHPKALNAASSASPPWRRTGSLGNPRRT